MSGALLAAWAAAGLALIGVAAVRGGRGLLPLRGPAAAAVLCLAAGAGLASLLYLPALDRFEALGHEASYAQVFRGELAPGGDWQPWLTYPLLRYLYAAVGALSGGESLAPLLILNAAARGLAVLALGAAAAQLAPRERAAGPALAAAALLALHPAHLFWGASIYNVSLPLALVLVATALALAAWRSGEPWLGAAAAATATTVPLLRVEWGSSLFVLLPLLAALGPRWGRHPRWATARAWWPVLLVGGVGASLVVLQGGDPTNQGGEHQLSGYLQILRHQVGLVELLGPLGSLAGGAALVAGLVALGRGPGLAAAAGLLGVWVALASFNDFAPRHALLPASLGALVAAQAVGRPGRAGLAGAALVLAVCAVGAAGFPDVAHRYYADEDVWEQRLEAAPRLDADALERSGCYLITDDERLWRMGLAGSHFNLMDEAEAAARWDAHNGCVLWLVDSGQWRLDGLDVAPRALKLRRWFRWGALGVARFEGRGLVEVRRMMSPPWR